LKTASINIHMIFDSIQILFWLFQSFVIGIWINRKIFFRGVGIEETILYAPITGFICTVLIASFFWFLEVPTYLMRYLFVSVVLFVTINLIQSNYFKSDLIKNPNFLWLILGSLLVIIHGSFLPFSEKLFQGYPLDRFFYQGGSILFEKYNITYFQDSYARLAFNGDKRSLMMDSLWSMGYNEISARPAVNLGFVIFNWATPKDLYRLGNAWEVFFRTLQFCGLLAIFCRVLGPKFISGFLAVSLVFGYWFQYTKDYNAWSSSACLAVTLSAIAYLMLIVEKNKIEKADRFYIIFITVAAVVIYPELGIPFCFIFLMVILSNKKLRNEILLTKHTPACLTIFICAVFTTHPHIIDFIKRQSGLAPFMVGGEEFSARGIFRLLASIDDRHIFLKSLSTEPWKFISEPLTLADMITGSIGLPYITYIQSAITLITLILIIEYFIFDQIVKKMPDPFNSLKRKYLIFTICLAVNIPVIVLILKKVNGYNFATPISLLLGFLILTILVAGCISIKNSKIRILLVLVASYQLFFIVMLIFKIVGGAYRVFPFWGAFSSAMFLIILASLKNKFFIKIAYLLAFTNIVFGGAIFYVTNTVGLEKFNSFYSPRNPVRHFEIENVRDKYDFDYTNLISDLKLCQSVYIAMPQNVDKEERAPRFQAVSLALFLENNGITHYLSMPYRNGSPLIGGEFHPGFNRQEVSADCTVEDDPKNGKIGYRLIRTR